MNIIKAGHQDIGRIAAVFTIAFENDPIFKFIFRTSERYNAGAPWLFASWVRWAVIFGEAWITEDGNAAMISRRIGDARMSFASMVRAGMLPTPVKLGLAAFYRFYFKVLPVLDKNHEKIMGKTPHWYGWMIGATSAGERLASPIIHRVRDVADERQMPIFLETATEANLPLYASLGFQIKVKKDISPECVVYFLLRDPQTEQL